MEWHVWDLDMKHKLIDVPVATTREGEFRKIVNRLGGEIVKVVEFSDFLLFLIDCKNDPQQILDAGFYSFVKSAKFQKYAEYS